MKKMTWSKMEELFREERRKGKDLTGYIVFTEDSFDKIYSLESRTYEVANKSWGFMDGKISNAIVGNSLDGSDLGIRLDWYMKGKDAWTVDYCYMED